MQLSNKRMEEILDALAKEVAQHLSATDILNEKPWKKCLDNPKVELIFKMVNSDLITEEEFGHLIKPHIGIAIAKDLGAREVIIKW